MKRLPANRESEEASERRRGAKSRDSRKDFEKLINALDAMHMAFVRIFPENHSELISAHSWKVCGRLYQNRNNPVPVNKKDVIENWRMLSDKHPMVGLTKARDHLETMIKLGLVEEYVIPQVSAKAKFVRGTSKLWGDLEKVYAIGVKAVKEAFR